MTASVLIREGLVKRTNVLRAKHVYVLSNQPAHTNLQRWSIFDCLLALEEIEVYVLTKGDAILTHSIGSRPGLNKAAVSFLLDLLLAIATS
jgi:hypothetical protein